MLGKIEETWSREQYDAVRFTYATAYMHNDRCDYSFHVGPHGLEAAKTLARAWADEIGGEYQEREKNGSQSVSVRDRHVTGRTQGQQKS